MPAAGPPPPLTRLLDEAGIAVRLPLDQWSADFGGRGITLHIFVQSLPQLEQCWGKAGARTLKGNTSSLILYGGGKDADELAAISTLCGERWRRVVTEDTKGLAKMPGVQRGEWEKVPVLTTAQISNMPPGQAVVLKRGLGGAFVGRTPTVLERKDRQAASPTDLAGTVGAGERVEVITVDGVDEPGNEQE